MFSYNDLSFVHLEITTRCQASCPMCARNNHGGLPNPFLKLKDMSLEKFQKIFSKDLLETINTICMCGNFGDPIINNDLIDMIKYVKKQDCDNYVSIHTNGGARSQEWWGELAEALPERHKVYFAIDGLEDTHHLYRIGTAYTNVIKNAKAFIDKGGIAEWVFIKFKHNEHQVVEAEKRSKDLGFESFTEKNTNRFIGTNSFEVLNKEGKITHYLEPPIKNSVPPVSKEEVNNFISSLPDIKIDCYAKKHKEIYIDVHGRMAPCCFIANLAYNNPQSRKEIGSIKKTMIEQYYDLLDELGGKDAMNLNQRSVREIFEDDKWHSVWDIFWNNKKLITCAKTCGNFKPKMKPKDQIFKNVINKKN